MNKIKLTEMVDTHRPYLELETSMLRTVKGGLMRLISEIESSEKGIDALIRIASHRADVIMIDRELMQRN